MKWGLTYLITRDNLVTPVALVVWCDAWALYGGTHRLRIRILRILKCQHLEKVCQARKLNRDDAMDCSRWNKLIKVG